MIHRSRAQWDSREYNEAEVGFVYSFIVSRRVKRSDEERSRALSRHLDKVQAKDYVASYVMYLLFLIFRRPSQRPKTAAEESSKLFVASRAGLAYLTDQG